MTMPRTMIPADPLTLTMNTPHTLPFSPRPLLPPLPRAKLDNEVFSKGDINNIYDKDTIDSTPAPDAPYSDNPNYAAQDYVSTNSNSPYSLRKRKFAPYSINTMKIQKKKENKIVGNVTTNTPLPLTHPTLIPPILSPNILDPTTPISHIH